ncbi:MAG: alpha/beta hydrolase, partial [Pseudomonadota bacterium]
MPQIALRGSTVVFREEGVGRPGTPVLLAHCSLAHSGLWKPIIAQLSATRPVIALDMPGHGRSDPPPEGEFLQLFARDACAVLAERFGRPAHLVGLSLGGATLGRLAIARPELCASLTLIEPVWFFLLDRAGRPAGSAAEREFNARMSDLGARGDWQTAARIFVEAWGAPGGYEALGPDGQAYAARCLEHLVPDFPMVNARPPGQATEAEIAGLAMPAMLINGAETQPSASAVLDRVQELLPQARRRRIEGAGHLSPVTHPQAVLETLTCFFDAAEAG